MLISPPVEPAVPSDEDVRVNVIEALRRDPDLHICKIDVSVTGGWITLEGTINAFWKKMQAEDIILGIRGVLGITNKLAIILVPTDFTVSIISHLRSIRTGLGASPYDFVAASLLPARSRADS